MNAFENIAIGLLQAAELEAPLFIKSNQGVLILNASEILLSSILARFAPAQAEVNPWSETRSYGGCRRSLEKH